MEKIIQFLKQYGVLSGIGLVGCGILIYGVYSEVKAENPVVEIIKGDIGSEKSEVRSDLPAQAGKEKGELAEILVDIAGAVEKPGLYKLTQGSRIGDALVIAGGLAANADREWVAKMINLAEPLKDGGKVFIPRISENSENQKVRDSVSQNGNKININTASLSELDSLSGIGEVRARLIMDNRPYGSTDELVSKAKIPSSVYETIKDSISIY